MGLKLERDVLLRSQKNKKTELVTHGARFRMLRKIVAAVCVTSSDNFPQSYNEKSVL